MKPSWRDVFDCKIHYGHISHMVDIVKQTGYKYFVWNGWIMELSDHPDEGLQATRFCLVKDVQ